MFDKKIIAHIISALSSILVIALFIILLPSILIVVGVLMIIAIIAVFVIKFLISKGKFNGNFIYVKRENSNQNNTQEEFTKAGEMKDVTNSSKSRKN
jgi:hypothetical protein